MSDGKREQLAEKIAELYVEARRNDEPDYKLRLGKKTDIVFLKAADLCFEHGLSAEEFVDMQYANKPEGVAFYPNTLLNRYSKPTKSSVNRISSIKEISPQLRYDIQMNYVISQLQKCGRNLTEILLDDKLELHPWFRIVATKVPIPEVVKKYKDRARAQLTPELVGWLHSRGVDNKIFI